MVTEVLAGQALLRVWLRIAGVSYSAGLTVDGGLELAVDDDVVDRGRFNGRHIVGISGDVLLPHAAYVALEEALQGSVSLVQYLAAPEARAAAPEFVP
ncbi:hypothetical protein [Sorangium sp. So ce1151]|uniref:hypothetical protein n=1 Tax=Sorangium sp. So ce1151 TaxID=3133332 RepID=UPI003F5E4729